MEKYYALTMDNYATASFVSASKAFYGTLEDIHIFIDRLPEGFEETKAAFQAFLDGNAAATHTVAYNKQRLLEPVRMVYEQAQVMGPQQWEHINVWGCPYPMKCEGVQLSQAVFLHQKQYHRCIRACFHNLHYSGAIGEWLTANGRFWGLPELLQVSHLADGHFTVENRLYVQEESFKIRQESIQSLTDTPPMFDKIIEEIFGDG